MVAAAVMNLRFLFINGEVTLPLGLLQGNSDMVQQREGYEYRSRGGILHVFGGQVTRHESGFLPPGNVLKGVRAPARTLQGARYVPRVRKNARIPL